MHNPTHLTLHSKCSVCFVSFVSLLHYVDVPEQKNIRISYSMFDSLVLTTSSARINSHERKRNFLKENLDIKKKKFKFLL